MEPKYLYWCIGIICFLSLTYINISRDIWTNQSIINSMEPIDCQYIDTIENEYKVPYMIVNASVPLYLDTGYSIHINKYNIKLCQECNEWYLKFKEFHEITECKNQNVSYYIVIGNEIFTTDDIEHHSLTGTDFVNMLMYSLLSFCAAFFSAIFVEECT